MFVSVTLLLQLYLLLKYKKICTTILSEFVPQGFIDISSIFNFVLLIMIFVLANQQNTPVSVVRVGASSQGDDNSQDSNGTCDSQNDGNPHVNLTVEGFYPPSTAQTSTSEGMYWRGSWVHL
jgi:hypothetical protein